jgi:hypothetical protein
MSAASHFVTHVGGYREITHPQAPSSTKQSKTVTDSDSPPSEHLAAKPRLIVG